VFALTRKALELLAPGERRNTLLLCLAVVIGATLEVASVAAIMPFMAVITAPDGGRDLWLLRWLHDRLPSLDPQAAMLYVGAMALGTLLLSAAVNLATRHAVIAFSYRRYQTLSRRLFEAYLRRGYEFFLTANSSHLSESVLVECETIVSKVFLGLMIVFSNSVVALGIVMAVLVIEPILGIMALLTVGGLYFLTYRLLRKRILMLGQRLQKSQAENAATVHQAFRSIEELKLFGAERFFLDRYALLSLEKAQSTGRAVALSELPRKVIETLAIGGALGLMLALAASRGSVRDLMPLIALFVFAAYRLLPSVQQVYQHLVKIRFYAPTLDHVHAELHPNSGIWPVSQDAPTPPSGDLTFEAVRYRYPGADRPALESLDLRIASGSVVAFVGPTGSGKSTAIGVLLGLLTPESGALRVGGQVLQSNQLHAWQRRIGYVPQEIVLLDDSVAANIAFGSDQPELDRVLRAAETACIREVIERQLNNGVDTGIGENGARLSGGERQRMGIARALYRDPELLVLDEATSALDNGTERAVIERILAKGRELTVVMVAHRMNSVRLCDCIHYFDQGRLVDSGRYDDLLNRCSGFARLVASEDKGVSA
jgi:ABC-type multidrug transport system fused ATPase/permease subunit